MAKKRRSKTRHSKKLFQHRWLIGILTVIVLFLGAYVGHHFYQRYQQQQIIERQQNAKRLFIKQVAPEAQAMQRKYNVPASITIAQAILESDWGSSKLAAKYHNLFGIKGTGENSQVLTTKEYVNGKWITTKGRFKVYSSWSESIKDHTKLMINGTDYNSQNYQAVTQASDYKEAAKALQEAHYATDPDYAQKLISVIQTYKLYNYDK